MSSKFNPALYVVRDPDGQRYLTIQAKILWMRDKFPGWRITSDGYEVFGLEDFDEEGNPYKRYVAAGHVAVIDEEGRRIISVPASVDIEDANFANDLFQAGAELALESLGFNTYNITAEQWQDAYALNSLSPDFPSASVTARSVSSAKQNLDGESGDFGSGSGDPYGASSDRDGNHEDRFPDLSDSGSAADVDFGPSAPPLVEPDFVPPEHVEEAFGGEAPAVSYETALNLFSQLAEKDPEFVIPGYQGEPLDDRKLERLFERYCFKILAVDWLTADETEQVQIIERLKKDLKRRS